MIVAIIAFPLFVLAELFEVFHWPAEQTGAHELAFESAFLAVAFFTFSWRRLKEQRDEITELNQAEDELQQANEELEDRVAERTAELGKTNVGLRHEISERKRAEALLAGQTRILENLAMGAALEEVLDALVRLAEEQADGMLCSILLTSVDGSMLRPGVAPNLPDSFNQAVAQGIPIGPNQGSCGTAAYRAEPVISADIANDPIWADYRELALNHGLRACWSTPIFSSTREVLGTFAMYYGEPRSPGVGEVQLIEATTHIAGLAIERRRAEEAKRKTNEELETANAELRQEISAREATEAQLIHSEKLASIGQLAAGVAHEINNPLGAIVGYAQLILEDGALSPASKGQLERVIHRAQGAAKVVRQLKEFAVPIELEKVSTDIHDVIGRTLSLMEAQMELANITVVRNYGSGLPAVLCDPGCIEQVFVNLILNARDAMEDGGTLTIATELSGDGQGVTVTISDTGRGMSKDNQARLFEPFYTAGKAGGTGLGLSISQRIVEDHGGWMEVESEPGRGSRFTVWLATAASEKVPQRAVA